MYKEVTMKEHPLLDFRGYDFHFILELPELYHVHDFTKGAEISPLEYSIGRYDENRKGLYESELFEGKRTHHVGIDIGGPVGTPIYAFYDGTIFDKKYLPAEGDYGNVIIMEHEFNGTKLWALYGHLSSESLETFKIGDIVEKGQLIGWLGDKNENGGWEPHVHFQLSLEEPLNCDLPGVVTPDERDLALEKYPDPRLVLGPLY
ncbi:MAG: peptidase M23 [Euryarchaeota archaeon]|nr:peptidase M23 [Euryarchaeota archaeon]